MGFNRGRDAPVPSTASITTCEDAAISPRTVAPFDDSDTSRTSTFEKIAAADGHPAPDGLPRLRQLPLPLASRV